MAHQDEIAKPRRDFLKSVASVSTLAAASAMAIEAREAHAYDPGLQETGARYRADSPDVQAFYRTNRYEF